MEVGISMSMIELARRRFAPLAPGWHRPARSVEVRVVVEGIEEDALSASGVETLVRSLGPILKHADDRAAIELVGVERGISILRVPDRHVPLSSLQDAVEFLRGER